MTEDSPKNLTLFDKLRLYPDIVLQETINKSRIRLIDLLARVNNPGETDNSGLLLEERQFKSEVQQVLMDENKILRKAFDSQGIFSVCD